MNRVIFLYLEITLPMELNKMNVLTEHGNVEGIFLCPLHIEKPRKIYPALKNAFQRIVKKLFNWYSRFRKSFSYVTFIMLRLSAFSSFSLALSGFSKT